MRVSHRDVSRSKSRGGISKTVNSNSGFKLNNLTLDTNNRTRTGLQPDRKGEVNQSGSIVNVSVASPESKTNNNRYSTINKEGMERKPTHHKEFSIVRKPSNLNSNKKLKKNLGSTVDTELEEQRKQKAKAVVALKNKKRSI